ncbi:MAG: FAD-dependent 5-carboxymethylaminomethyl-2-thiouridine(34) oxidoreductase MnmC, partial [Pseudomonadales bacterium]|nr:FAD-dependent 5-carboxymethylaminomethyl-2-thiouridine(34) oxidoreductase MnmC [Pseudomonadales bacterium]
NQDGLWQILDPNGRELSRSPTLVITASAAMKQWTDCADLPVEQVRGQLTHIASNPRSEALKTVVCAARSLFPASDGSHCLAATYQRHDDNLQCRPADDASNLQLARQALREPQLLGSEITASRSAIRSSTPDRLPLLGPVPDLPAMLERFADLNKDASLQFEQAGVYHPGLYVSAAHGSNGLSSCSLGGEYLASLICGETPPLDDSIMAALNPVRFLIRELKKQKSPRLTQR